MKLTMLKITDGYKALSKLLGEKLPIKIAITVSANIKALEEYAKIADEKRMELVKEYGEKDSKGEVIQSEDGQVKITDMPRFIAGVSEINSTEVEVNVTTLPVDAFGDRFEISVADLMAIEFMLESGN